MNHLPGVSSVELLMIKKILSESLSINQKVFAFGSRVNGTFRNNSDLDLLIESESNLELAQLSKLKDRFEESNLPFKIDLIDSKRISIEILKNIKSLILVQIFPSIN